MNLKKLHDDITEIVANGLHQIERAEEIRSLKTAAEVTEAVEGGATRYADDVVFRARVQVLVAQVMRRVSDECNAAVEKGSE